MPPPPLPTIRSATARVRAALDADAVLDGLDPEQREVALAVSGPVCVLAGAGTGKTRAITHRIAYAVHAGIYAPQHVLAVTFTARAAGQMRSRLRDLAVGGVQARTFHAAALRQLTYFWPRTIGGPAPAVQEHKAGLVADAASRLRLSVDRAAVRDLAAEIEWAKVGMLAPDGYAAAATRAGRGQPGGFDVDTVARLIEVYEQVKGDRNVMDFEDVLLLTVGVLEEHAEVAEAVRAQYRHLVVDEYQDVNALQQRLLDQWLGGREDLCVVGDPHQTIYSFAGASPSHLQGFVARYPSAKVVRLVRDYRSTPQVVGLANKLLLGSVTAGARPPIELQAQRPPGPVPTLTAYDDDVAEAAGVVARLRGLLTSGVRPSEVAVLFRTNAQSQAFEQELAEASIAYVLRGGERFFARREVRDAVLLLRGAARSPAGEDSLGEAVRAVLTAAGWSPTAPASGGAVRDRWESLQALAVLADELAEGAPESSLTDLVTELDERAAAQHAPTVEGVTLASLHAAKGLEWDAVFLVGLCEGLMPISLAEGWAAVEEERRLLYVGVTRSREHLHLSWTRARTPGGRATRSPSRFLEGLFPEASSPAGRRGSGPGAPRAGQGGSGRGGSASGGSGREASGSGESRSAAGRGARGARATRCRSCGSPLSSAAERKIGRCDACPPTYDEGLFERLRQWRSAAAAQAGVPAYVVFTDATLVAIAEMLPADLTSLLGVAGVGPAKLDRYGPEVLAVLEGPDR